MPVKGQPRITTACIINKKIISGKGVIKLVARGFQKEHDSIVESAA